jgi:hypothetical protein
MKRIGSATDGAFWLAGPAEGSPARGSGDESGVGLSDNRERFAGGN